MSERVRVVQQGPGWKFGGRASPARRCLSRGVAWVYGGWVAGRPGEAVCACRLQVGCATQQVQRATGVQATIVQQCRYLL